MRPAAPRSAGQAARRALTVVAALAASAALAAAMHRLVADERLGDRASLAVAGATAALLAFGALAALPWRRPRRPTTFILPLGLASICAAFVAGGLIDASVEMEAVLEAGRPASTPATIVVGPGGQDVRFAGEITEGAARRLGDLLAAHSAVRRIHLTSEGGLADEGQALGDVIAAHGLSTYVPDYCVSACTLAFVRGSERLMESGARLGFHSPYEQGLFGKTYRGDGADQRAAYVAAGVAPAFADAALAVDPSDVWFPTGDELLAARAITRTLDRYALPDSSLDGANTLDGAREAIARSFPLARVLLERAPDALDAVASWYLDAYRGARSEGDTADALAGLVRGAVGAGLARADDATLPDLARYLGRALVAARSPRACAAIAGGDLGAAANALGDSADGAALLARALGGRHVAAAPSPMPEPDADCVPARERLAQLLQASPAAIAGALRPLLEAQAARAALPGPAPSARVATAVMAGR